MDRRDGTDVDGGDGTWPWHPGVNKSVIMLSISSRAKWIKSCRLIISAMSLRQAHAPRMAATLAFAVLRLLFVLVHARVRCDRSFFSHPSLLLPSFPDFRGGIRLRLLMCAHETEQYPLVGEFALSLRRHSVSGSVVNHYLNGGSPPQKKYTVILIPL